MTKSHKTLDSMGGGSVECGPDQTLAQGTLRKTGDITGKEVYVVACTDKESASRRYEAKLTSDKYIDYLDALNDYFSKTSGAYLERLENFPKYVPRGILARFIAKYEILKKVLTVQGSIIECGVLYGGGLMTWAQLSAILEPANHQRRIIGFDTFSGFPSISKEDQSSTSEFCKEGELGVDSYQDLLECIRIYDMARFLGHIEKVMLVKGDIKETIPRYIDQNPHTVVSLLYLDVDLFEPTAVALKHIVPRMPKGGVIAFDELNLPTWPGETQAVMQQLGINSLRIQRFRFGTSISYAVIE